jgi:hypothetical protein
MREYERRKRNREQRTRDRHPHIGGFLLALRDPPQHETAFMQGARGEAALAASLEKRTARGPVVLLYDRRMPGGQGNIDILAVAPSGIYVIDAKDHKGKVSITTPLFGPAKLRLAGRDRTHLLDGLDRQVAAVRVALGERDVPPVRGVLCFMRADLPLLGRTVRSHLLLDRKQVAKRLNANGPSEPQEITALAASLATSFPPA